MGGCLRSVGCLTLLIVAAIGGYVMRDRWLPALTGTPAAPSLTFEAVTEARRESGRRSIESLRRTSGPVFANLTAAEASALVLRDARQRIPALVGVVDAAVSGDRLVLRATVDPAALRAVDALGPLLSLLNPRPRLTLSGTLDVAEPGRALFDIRDVRVNDLIVPPPAIGALVRQLDRRPRPAGEPERSIGFEIPSHVGDIRVGKGRVTLYKTVP